MFKFYIFLLRPHHWIKNFIIFAPPIFVPTYVSVDRWLDTIYIFLGFCICTSAIYVFNDLLDVDRDKLDSRTSSRPMAKGIISKRNGMIISIILLVLSIVFTTIFVPKTLVFILFYTIINIFYSIKLKFIVGLDVTVITLGFISRIMAGGIAASIEQSYWTLTILGFASLSLALGKRLGQLQVRGGELSAKWDSNILLILSILSIAITVFCYIIFSFDTDVISRHENNYIWTTIPSIVFIFARYFQLCLAGRYSGDPTLVLLKDPIIQIFVIIWIAIISYIFVI